MKLTEVRTPAYVIDEKKLRENLEILDRVQKESGAKILLAQKAYSVYQTYPLIAKYLTGATASGLYEARLAHEELKVREGIENHVYEPAFEDDEMAELCQICDHIVFNSLNQLEHHRKTWEQPVREGKISVGLRINPEFSTQEEHEIYDPCSEGSRLGIKLADMPAELPEGVEGIHFHTLCEQDFEPLRQTFHHVEENFGRFFPLKNEGQEPSGDMAVNGAGRKIKWINLGGGHHITREDYNVDGLITFIKEIKSKYDMEVYLEPGEAIALDAGYLVTTVMDIVHTQRMPVLVLDTSAACHMPDVLEMPYRPPLRDSEQPGELEFNYRLSSRTCLAGDVIGDYSFVHEINIGDKLIFEDMAIYSMVKNNTFNGMPLPDIDIMHENGEVEVIKKFGYQDFKMRL
ncbi:MAG: carboxynorspermidine decarboxylase [Butyrivibrio sp.]|uniref:carboxynorspermidine decarboxylase n=1 Tax=Butyrivibrio sp. TaxID=28121 RepID=UPI0025BA9680|nr:carboxynorspermidine decarboxylase [Butyrivibrio sp.]MBQ6589529.1 carboxynorspermidine decarboxylase [Butyrivibrio sp.]